MPRTRGRIEKFADKVRDAVSDLLDVLTPQPEAVPIPIPVREAPRRG